MTRAVVPSFEDSLRALDVGVTRTDPGGLSAVLGDVSDEPVVGAPLPFEGLSLPATVETDPTPADLDAARTGVTAAVFAVADYGSLVLESTPDGVEPISLFPDRHVAVLRADDVVPDMAAAFERLGPRLREGRDPGANRSAILATGPSATADMGALVKGAHGPKSVHVVLVEGSEDDPDDASGVDGAGRRREEGDGE
jgi:L-lactate dehydrogenase complex protein LldG